MPPISFRILMVFCLLGLPIISIAQSAVYASRFISTVDGLPDRFVKSIAQDQNGAMWFASTTSLMRYDGYRFRQIELALSTTDAINDIKAGGSEMVVTTTEGRIFLIEKEDVKVVESMSDVENPRYCQYYNHTNGEHWILYPMSGVISRYDSQWASLDEVSIGGKFTEILDRRQVLMDGYDDDVFIVGSPEVIYILNDKGAIKDSLTREQFGHPGSFRSLKADPNGDIWIVCGSDLQRFRADSRFESSSARFDISPTHPCFLPTSDHELLVGSHTFSTILYDKRGGKVELDLNTSGYPSWNPVSSVFLDANNDIWLGCQAGVFVIHRNRRPFNSIDIDGDPNGPVDGMGIRGMYHTHNGRTFFNTDGRPFNELLPNDEARFHVDRAVGALSFYTLMRYQNKLISRGGSYFDLITGENRLDSKGSVSNECLASDNRIWSWSLADNQIQIKDPKIDSITKHIPISNWVNEIRAGRDGHMWVSHTGGINIYDVEGKAVQFDLVGQNDSSLSGADIYCSLGTDEKTVWAGSKEGVIAIDLEYDTTVVWTIDEGLSHNTVYSMLPEGDSAIWLGTGNGLDRLDIRTGEILNFNTTHGLAHNEFNRFATMIDSQGNYYFGGLDGITRFNPGSVLQALGNDPRTRLMCLDMVKFDGQHSLSIDPLHGKIDLQPVDRILSVTVGLNDYMEPKENEFRYILEGFEQEWSNPSTQNLIKYTNIPPGEYRLRVQGRSASGRWSEDELDFVVVKSKAFYATVWFFALCMFAVAMTVYAFLTVRYKRRLQVERIRTKLASDLHDEVGGLLSGMAMQMDLMEDEVQSGLKAKVHRLGNLSRDAVLRMKDVIWAVDARKDTFGDLHDRLRSFTGEILDSLEISCHYRVDGIEPHQKLSADVRENIYFISKEAITNAVKHAEATEIIIDFRSNGTGFHVAVIDNGIGLKQENGHGQGMDNMKMRAARIGAALNINSHEGTTIKVKVPKY